MMHLRLVVWLCACCVCPILAAEPTTRPSGNPALPGRQVKVAAIPIGFGGQHDAKLKLGLDHLRAAGEQHVDIACLPEEFSGLVAEPVSGLTTDAVAALAREFHMYVICPLREQADGVDYNTAVLIDRQGKVVGRYRKVFPV